MLINWLCVVYEALDRKNDAKILLENNIKLHPAYIYNITGLAKLELEEGNFMKVKELFKNTWNIKELFPDRNVFHIGEVISFLQVTTEYFHQSGNEDEAKRYLAMLKEVHPKKESPIIEELEKKIAIRQ